MGYMTGKMVLGIYLVDISARMVIFRDITYVFADFSRSDEVSEICNFLCLERGPTELHIWLSGELTIRKMRNKIT